MAAGLLPDGFVDSVALNMYHDGSEGIQVGRPPRHGVLPQPPARPCDRHALPATQGSIQQGSQLALQCTRRFQSDLSALHAALHAPSSPLQSTHPAHPPTPTTPGPAEPLRRRRPLQPAHLLAAPLQRQPSELRHTALWVSALTSPPHIQKEGPCRNLQAGLLRPFDRPPPPPHRQILTHTRKQMQVHKRRLLRAHAARLHHR